MIPMQFGNVIQMSIESAFIRMKYGVKNRRRLPTDYSKMQKKIS